MAVPSLRSAILGINRRNREFVYPLNPRAIRGLADDKAGAREILEEAGLPMPALYDRVETVARIPRTMDHLGARTEPFVVKPCRGSRGRGILMLRGDGEGGFRRLNGSTHPTKLVRRHLATILSGEFSMKAGMDEALIEEYIETESSLKTLFAEGAPDLRVLLHHGSPAMAMARIPTRRSDGRANLHQGALGVGIDLDTGQGLMGVHRETRIVDRHPDTNIPVTELSVPY